MRRISSALGMNLLKVHRKLKSMEMAAVGAPERGKEAAKAVSKQECEPASAE